MLGEQSPSAGEAARAPRLRLVRAHGAGLAGPEAVGGEEAWRALACKSEVTAQALGRGASVQARRSAQPSPVLGKAPRHRGGGSWGRSALCGLGQAWLCSSHQLEGPWAEKWPCSRAEECGHHMWRGEVMEAIYLGASAQGAGHTVFT